MARPVKREGVRGRQAAVAAPAARGLLDAPPRGPDISASP
jgi:hypothetical protein